MERRLILMRHAKSSWSSGAVGDHDRPLNKRGKRDAPRVAAALAARGWHPEVVYSSTAKRTRQTWRRMQRALEQEIDVVFVEGLYHGDLGDIRDAAATWPSEVETVLVLGHNPGWEMALYQLSAADAPMTTGNAALLEGEGDSWDEALRGDWHLVELIRPRELDAP